MSRRRKDTLVWYVERERERKWSRAGATLSGLLDVADTCTGTRYTTPTHAETIKPHWYANHHHRQGHLSVPGNEVRPHTCENHVYCYTKGIGYTTSALSPSPRDFHGHTTHQRSGLEIKTTKLRPYKYYTACMSDSITARFCDKPR